MIGPNSGAIAQLGERYNGIVEVSGSIPLSSTKLVKGTTRLQAGFFCILDKPNCVAGASAFWSGSGWPVPLSGRKDLGFYKRGVDIGFASSVAKLRVSLVEYPRHSVDLG